MVVKIPKKLEMKSLLPAPCSPLPAHVLAFPPKALPVKALPGLIFFEVFFLILEPLD
jgi:hypothetical protein